MAGLRTWPERLRWLSLVLAGWLLATASWAAITVAGTTSGRNEALPIDGSPGALTMPKPSGVTPGLALVVSISARPRSMTVVVPSGWQLMTFTDQPNGGTSTAPGGSTLVTYYKIATASEPASYTWTFANPANDGGMVVGAMVAVNGVKTTGTNLIDNNGTAWSANINPSGLTFSTGTITTVTPNTVILSSITYLSASYFNAPSGITGITEAIDVSSPVVANATGITLQMSTVTKASTGSAGPVTSTAARDADYGIGHLLAMQPSGIDPWLTMTRNGTLSPGGSASYTLVVKNVGQASEPGPLSIVDTLPAGLSFSSGSGTGWSCGASGQTVTCTRSGALASDATAASLTINVSVGGGASGPLTNSATVSSGGVDDNPYNNLAVDTYVVPTNAYAYYAFDEASWGTITDATGNGHTATDMGGVSPTGTNVPSPPGAAIAGSPGTCGAANIADNTSPKGINTGIDPNSLGTSGSIAFWYSSDKTWNDGTSRMLFDASANLSTGDRHFFLAKSGSGALVFSLQDSAGTVATATTANYGYNNNQWHHIAVTWNVAASQLAIYLDGVLAGSASTTLNGTLGAVTTIYLGSVRSSGITGAPAAYTTRSADGYLDEARIYASVLTLQEVVALTTATHVCTAGIHHYELSLPTTGITCLPTTVSVTACSDSSSPCTNKATTLSGTTVTLGANAGILGSTTLTFDATGVASTLYGYPLASNGSVATVSLSAEQALALTARKCCPNGISCAAANSCSITYSTAGFVFDVPDHRSEVSRSITVAAVRQSDSSAACTAAFGSVTKAVNFACNTIDPSTGTLPVRVGGVALNSGNSSAAACDAGGRAVSLAFNASGVATTTVQYADVGSLSLTASYTGSGADLGVYLAGSDSFIVAPYNFSVSSVSASPIAAGSAFSATVTALNYLGAATPNFGRETSAEGVTLGFARSQPTGSGAVTGSFSGTAGVFSAGAALASNLAWTEVGRGDVSAVLTSGSYLGSGMKAAGSSAGGLIFCANEGSTCTLPTGATATVYYGALGRVTVSTGLSGAIACNSTTFTDPYPGQAKTCQYVVTTGVAPGAAGNSTFKPHHFDLTVTPACTSFSYAGQPFVASATARNASGSTTLNYDGTAATSPNFAKATALSDAGALGVGSLSGNSLAASAFTAGQGSAVPSYSFTAKATSARTLALRAIDADSVSSAGYTEGSTGLRSGRLRLSNAFGSAKASLQVPVVAEYWSGSSWVLNSSDNCTALAAGSVVQSNPRTSAGNASSATSSASGFTLASGSGFLTLTAPSPAGSSLSLDLALNLGATTADQSCVASHPASTGAAKPWLRSFNGSCSGLFDRDPGARASFGIYGAETRKTVHVRDVF